MNLKTFLVLLLLASFTPKEALACRCIADPFSKKYQLFERTWYGTKRHWSCDYQCENNRQQSFKITGYHKNWYMTDRGLEGICDGLVYSNRYSPAKGDFFWDIDRAEHFNPKKSTSKELQSFFKNECQ